MRMYVSFNELLTRPRLFCLTPWIISRTSAALVFWFIGFFKRFCWLQTKLEELDQVSGGSPWLPDRSWGPRVQTTQEPLQTVLEARGGGRFTDWCKNSCVGVHSSLTCECCRVKTATDCSNVTPQIRMQRSTWCRMERGWRRRRRQSRRTPSTLITTSPSASRSRLSRSR